MDIIRSQCNHFLKSSYRIKSTSLFNFSFQIYCIFFCYYFFSKLQNKILSQHYFSIELSPLVYKESMRSKNARFRSISSNSNFSKIYHCLSVCGLSIKFSIFLIGITQEKKQTRKSYYE